MDLLEMYKQLNDENKAELSNLIIYELKKREAGTTLLEPFRNVLEAIDCKILNDEKLHSWLSQ